MGSGLKTLAGEENCVLLFKVQSSLPIPPLLGLFTVCYHHFRQDLGRKQHNSGLFCSGHRKQRNWALFCSSSKAAELGVVLTTLLVFRPRSEELSPRLNKKATYNETNYNDLTDQILSE